ncbi:MAG: DUF3459 domain-containing protein, partial [Clostridiales bacterium]|nr:DUF3459 domain-containing protein [Clostridiales bacterium]
DPASLLHTVRALLALRHRESDLQSDAPFAPVCTEKGRPFVYRRGGLLIAVNPAGEALTAPVDAAGRRALFAIGSVDAAGEGLTLGAQSFVVLR